MWGGINSLPERSPSQRKGWGNSWAPRRQACRDPTVCKVRCRGAGNECPASTPSPMSGLRRGAQESGQSAVGAPLESGPRHSPPFLEKEGPPHPHRRGQGATQSFARSWLGGTATSTADTPEWWDGPAGTLCPDSAPLKGHPCGRLGGSEVTAKAQSQGAEAGSGARLGPAGGTPPKGHEGTQATPSAGDSKPTASGEGAERSPRRECAGSLAPPPTPRLAQGRDQAGEEGSFHLNETWKPSRYSGRGSFYTEKM